MNLCSDTNIRYIKFVYGEVKNKSKIPYFCFQNIPTLPAPESFLNVSDDCVCMVESGQYVD